MYLCSLSLLVCAYVCTCVWCLFCIVAVRKLGFGDIEDNLALKHGVYSGSRTASTDLGYRGLSTTIMSKATSQESMVCNASPISHMQSLVTTHLDVTCASNLMTMQIPSQSAGEESGPLREPDTTMLKGEHRVTNGAQRWVESAVHNSLPPPPPAAEAALDDLCWIPFGIQSQSVGSEGGKLSLEPSDGAIGGEVGGTILLKVPPGVSSPAESVEVRFALIPDGPFTLPEGYQLGSMVVYLYYDGQHLTKPTILSLPHWYGGEDQVRDVLSFAMAPHTLKEGESVYNFELLEGGKMLSSHCGKLEIDEHSSMFAVVFRKGAISRYQAMSLQKQKGDETKCHVAVTFADPLWRGVSTHNIVTYSMHAEYMYAFTMAAAYVECADSKEV